MNRDKYKRAMRAKGISLRVPAAPATRHLRMLRDTYHVSVATMADMAAVSQGTIVNLLRGHGPETPQGKPLTAHRDTVQRVLTLPVPATPLRPPGDRRGPRLPSAGAIRRIEILALKGYPLKWMANEYLGMKRPTVLHYLIAEFVHAKTFDKVCSMYDDLKDKNPDDFGVSKHSQAQASTFAQRRNAAPETCWDDIDDPDAIAEWTGECGTLAGYAIHRRERHKFWKKDEDGSFIQVVGCDPCRKANVDDKKRRLRTNE
jgi:hypothetical protein